MIESTILYYIILNYIRLYYIVIKFPNEFGKGDEKQRYTFSENSLEWLMLFSNHFNEHYKNTLEHIWKSIVVEERY